MWNLSFLTYSVIQVIPLACVCAMCVGFTFIHFCLRVNKCMKRRYVPEKLDIFLKNCSRQHFNVPSGPVDRLMRREDVISDSSNRPVTSEQDCS